MTDPSITLSDAAARRIKSLARDESRPLLLRVAVSAGGCSGFQYEFDLVEQAETGDLVLEHDGARAVIDQVSMLLLKGSEIDYVDELVGAQFRVNNPNAKSSCGCGVSFSV